MDDVISLSSDSDVEVVGNVKADPPEPVRVDVDAVGVPTLYINLTDPRWTLPALKLNKRKNPTAFTAVNLAETANETKQETGNLPREGSPLTRESTAKNQPSIKQDCNLQKSAPPAFAPQKDCGDSEPKKRRLDSQTQHQKHTDKTHHCTPIVKIRRLPLLEARAAGLKTSMWSVCLNERTTQMSLPLRELANNCEVPECICNFSKTTALDGPPVDPSLDESPPKVVGSLIRQEEQENSSEFTSTQLSAKTSQRLPSPADTACSDKVGSVAASKENSTREDERDNLCSSLLIPSPIAPSSSQDEAQDSLVFCSKLEQPELDKAESRQRCLSEHSFPNSSTTGPNPSEHVELDSLSHPSLISHNRMSQFGRALTPEHTLTENTFEWLSEVKAVPASNSSDFLHWSVPSEPPLTVSNEDMDDRSEAGTYRGDLSIDSPVSSLWLEGSDADEGNKESRFDMDFRVASREDRQFVCPDTLRKIMSGPVQARPDEDAKGFGTPEVLCRQSLSLVYSTIDENYPEGTLQLLSDLLQPGHYPPRDITSHLLRGILLDPQCPHHLCVQAFNLLMRTQRHHMADKTTVPWDWELLTSVTANQRHPCEVVRMLLDYAVQTLEDDFQAKRSISALNHSIAKAILSCDQQFHRVREVINWLFSAILKSTEHGESREAAREKDEQIRMVSIFQRMLSLALEVDRCPALNSAKLSQELFHVLISNAPLRAHRMLLLESLQSKLLRCKLLEHLLDYACPLKTPLPMSLGLLLHFLKHCTLAPEPSDGTERWQTWEELVHLLWMLLLSYNKAMKGYLCNSVSELKGRVGNLVYKPDDLVSKSAIREAVEAFLSRSQADLGQALPLHVEESLTYLQDHLLDVCQC